MHDGHRLGQRYHALARGALTAVLRHLHELLAQQSECEWGLGRCFPIRADFPQDKSVSNQFRPAILQTFGDIAQAIGPHFETYLSVVAQVLQAAANVSMNETSGLEMFDYIISLREGIMDAWSGAILAMKQSKAELLAPYVEPIFTVLGVIAQDPNRSEALLRSAMGVVGDLADTFPHGEYANLFRQDWLTALIKDVKTNREFQTRTLETARWAREQVKRQIAVAQGAQTMS